MVATAENGACEMWDGEADEHNGAAEGSDDGNEYAAGDDDHHAGTADVKAEVGSISVAKQHQVHGLHQEARQGQQHAHQIDEEHHVVARDA